jgi:hypothetical protein
MDELLARLIGDWSRDVDGYVDVAGRLWVPGSPRQERCREGCHLEVYESPLKWVHPADPSLAVGVASQFCRSFRGCSYIEKPATFEDWRRCMEEVTGVGIFGPE